MAARSYWEPKRGMKLPGAFVPCMLRGRAGKVVQGLSIEDDIPPPRHANILNWKADIDAAKLQAMSIAEEAEYVPA